MGKFNSKAGSKLRKQAETNKGSNFPEDVAYDTAHGIPQGAPGAGQSYKDPAHEGGGAAGSTPNKPFKVGQ